MKLPPLVSVILTCYNIRDYIADAIRSVQQQSYDNLELIIVDDGSTDGSDVILEHFAKQSDITILYKQNSGPSSARNLGVQHAKGELVAFLDGDDVWEPHKLERQVAAMLTNPGVGLVFSDFSTFDSTGIVVTSKNQSMFTDLEPVTFDYLVSRNNFIYPSTVIVRRKILDQCGGFDESLRGPEDWDLWLRIARNWLVIGIHSPLARIRQHATNISANATLMLENERRAIEKHRLDLGCVAYRKRIARLYLLNADRSIHCGNRWQALRLLFKGLSFYPFHAVSVCIVLAKFAIGGKLSESLRRTIDNRPVIRSCFEKIFKWY